MIKEGQLFYLHQGNTYWWARGKYNIVLDLMQHLCADNISPKNLGAKILDVGSGPGNMLNFMKNMGDTYGNDTSPDAVQFLKSKGIKVVEGDVSIGHLSLADSSLTLITLIDSLEHMKDDLAALKEVYRLLAPGGQAVITVPSYMALWGGHDEKYGHYRRYTLGLLKKNLLTAGFRIDKISYFQPIFLIPLYLFRKIKQIKKNHSDDIVPIPSWLNKILLFILSTEKYYLRYFNFYFGATVLAIARKPK